MAGPVLEQVQLGSQWVTVDPFLFCVHHRDAYPRGDGRHAPAASLSGRSLGSDFADIDGWNMYHGQRVPGFPQHPHRGFETLTFVRRGIVDHADSLGASARYGQGDAQWMTAGGGIVHSEMFPLLDADDDNPLELFQIWINLAATDKMVEPHFSMFWDHQIPQIRSVAENGAVATATVVAGALGDARPPSPPPASWASRTDADVAVWHIALEPGATFELPAAADDRTRRTLYLFSGDSLHVGGDTIEGYTGALVDASNPVELGADEAAELLVLQGRPIAEPVASYGPFVMNSNDEIQQAFADYRSTGFGGWPWPSDDPVHGDDPARFAKHSDGRVEYRSETAPASSASDPD